MNRKIAAIVGVALLGIVAVPVLYAQHRMHAAGDEMMGGFGPFGHMRQVANQLDLTDAQRTQIRGIIGSVHDGNAAYRKQMHANIAAAAKVLLADPNNLEGARAILRQNAAAEETMKANMLDGVARAVSVLTPEQRTKLSGIIDEHANGV